MLRKKGDTYEIDRELTGKLAIESNAKLQDKVEELEEEIEVWKNANKKLRMHDARMEYENKELKEEVEQLKNQRIFNSTEYDLITLTSTTPQWELRRK